MAEEKRLAEEDTQESGHIQSTNAHHQEIAHEEHEGLDFRTVAEKFQPILAHPKSIWNGHGHRPVSWGELFYDLLYVAAAVKLAEILKHSLSAFSVITFIVISLTFWNCWFNYTLYYNRYTAHSFAHEFLFGFHAVTVLGMLMSIRTENGGHGLGRGNEKFFALWVGLNRITLSLAFLWVTVKVQKEKVLNTVYSIRLFLFGTVCLVFAGVEHLSREGTSEIVILPLLAGVIFADNFELWYFRLLHTVCNLIKLRLLFPQLKLKFKACATTLQILNNYL